MLLPEIKSFFSKKERRGQKTNGDEYYLKNKFECHVSFELIIEF